jgi:hypothetical protein
MAETPYISNLEDDRRAVEVMFGIALYEGGMGEDGRWIGRHYGVTGTHEAALEWVEHGPDPDDLVVVHRA